MTTQPKPTAPHGDGNQHRGDFISANAFSVEELRDALFRESKRLTPEVALALLARKDYPGKVDDLRRVLVGTQQSRRLRSLAAVELGRTRTDAAIDVLVEVATTAAADDPDLVRGVVEGLSLAGGLRALDSLDKLRTRADVGTVALSLARTLRYRLGAAGDEFAMPEASRLLEADPQRALPMRITTAPAESVRKALVDLPPFLTDIDLVEEGASEIICADQTLLFLRHRNVVPTSGKATSSAARAALPRRKMMVGVVAQVDGVETDVWMPQFQVLAQPSGDKDELHLFVVTMRGTLAMAGTASLAGRTAQFKLTAVDQPGVTPLSMQGAFTENGLEVERAFSGPTALNKLRPTPLPRPRR
jgi:hypothetical protein